MRFLPSGLVPFICSCLLPTLCLARLSFDVESSVEHYGGRGQCLIYRIPGNSLVTGYFKVWDADSNQPFSQPELTGESNFSFRSGEQTKEFQFCIRVTPRNYYSDPSQQGNQVAALEFDVKYDYDLFDPKMAAAFAVKPIETEFFQLEESIRRMADELEEFVRNEEILRNFNESILEQLTWFSLFAIAFLVGLGCWQLYYLKRFFKAKKLI